MSKNKEILKKLGRLFITVGALHMSTLSFGPGFYEPKISPSLIKKMKETHK